MEGQWLGTIDRHFILRAPTPLMLPAKPASKTTSLGGIAPPIWSAHPNLPRLTLAEAAHVKCEGPDARLVVRRSSRWKHETWAIILLAIRLDQDHHS
jgi:hypothetical protein